MGTKATTNTLLSLLCVLRKRIDDNAFPPLPVISGV